MKISAGSVLDPYDDEFASLSTFFQKRSMPDFIKTASIMSGEEHSALPDHAFAVVLVGPNEQLRKYACTDKPHTAVNVLYFLEHKNELPPTARVKTASNLTKACRHFGMRPTMELAKLAASGKRLIKSDGAEIMVKEKEADVSGTSIAPRSARPSRAKAKIASFLESPYVRMDEPDFVFAKQAAEESMCALSGGRLPLYSYTQVKEAADFFRETGRSMHPRVRHELCSKLVKRADDLGVPVTDIVRKYGSLEYAPDGEFEATVSTRRRLWKQAGNQEGPGLLDLLMEKRASVKPEIFAESLAQIDTRTGIDHFWDNGVCDPWLTTFGFRKEAAGWSWKRGGESLDESRLRKLASNRQLVESKFGEAMAQGFAENPTVVFDSLPVDTQRVIAAMARA
jgi:hypothetical protein